MSGYQTDRYVLEPKGQLAHTRHNNSEGEIIFLFTYLRFDNIFTQIYCCDSMIITDISLENTSVCIKKCCQKRFQPIV